VLYTRTCIVLWRKGKVAYGTASAVQMEHLAKRKLAVKMIVCVTLFFLCYAPETSSTG